MKGRFWNLGCHVATGTIIRIGMELNILELITTAGQSSEFLVLWLDRVALAKSRLFWD